MSARLDSLTPKKRRGTPKRKKLAPPIGERAEIPAENPASGLVEVQFILEDRSRRVRVHVNRGAWSIGTYLARGLISSRQHEAGEWYRRQFELSGQQQRMTAPYGSNSAVGETAYGMPFTEVQAHHRKLWRAAREAIPAMLLEGFDAMVIFEVSAASTGGAAGFRGKYASAVALDRLRVCLDTLADHLRLARE